MKKLIAVIIAVFVIAAVLFVLLFSKKSVQEIPVGSISELEGKWNLPDGGCAEFPVSFDGEDFLAVYDSPVDFTEKWKKLSFDSYGSFDFQRMWQKRFSLCSDFPKTLDSGIQVGYKIEKGNASDTVSYSKSFLIPKKYAENHLDLFQFRIERRFLKKNRFLEKNDAFSSINKCFDGVEFASDSLGLVLAGGGGKGAYEIGVYKAMEEFALAQKVTVFSGTSVGGLNSALLACAPVSEASRIWLDVAPAVLRKDEFSTDFFLSQKGIENLIEQIDLSILSKSFFPKVYVTAVKNEGSVDGFIGFGLSKLDSVLGDIFGYESEIDVGANASRFLLNDEGDVREIKKELLATSAFPFFTEPVTLKDGFKYSDGGNELLGGDNIPLAPVLSDGEKVNGVVVVYLSKFFEKSEVRNAKGLDEINVFPSEDLGDIFSGTLNFDREKIDYLMDLGYSDMKKILEGRGLRPVCKDFWFK